MTIEIEAGASQIQCTMKFGVVSVVYSLGFASIMMPLYQLRSSY